MSQIQEQQTQETPQAAQGQQVQPTAQPQDNADIFADHITEEMLGAMLDGDKADDAPKGGEQPAGQPPDTVQEAGDAPPQMEEDAKQAQDAEQRQDQEPEAYELELFGTPAKLSGDQLIELAEAGAQLMRHRPQVEQAMSLMQAVHADPNLQAILAAYAQGQPLPQVGAGPQQPAQADPNDPLAGMRAQVVAELAPLLKQQLMAEMQQHYKPFVDSVNSFAAEHRREREFGKYASDPDYAAVNDLMQRNVQAKVAAGEISFEQASMIDRALKDDPTLYGQWFGRFKGVVQQARKQSLGQQPAGQSGAGGQPAGAVKTVTRAPRLEGAAASDPAAMADSVKHALNRALQGDANAFNALYDNQ